MHPKYLFLSDDDNTYLSFFGNASYDEDEVHTIELAEEKKEIAENQNKQTVSSAHDHSNDSGSESGWESEEEPSGDEELDSNSQAEVYTAMLESGCHDACDLLC